MSVGTGIFLGLFICALAYLYSKNRESWTAKRIGKFLGIAILLLISVVLLLIGGTQAYEYIENRPVVQSQLREIRIGESLGDVLFRMGEATKDEKWKPSDPDKYPLPVDGVYNLKDKKGILRVANGKIVRVGYYCDDTKYDSTTVNGISCGSTSQAILDKFGKETEVLCRKGGDEIVDPWEHTVRLYLTKKYHVEYYLQQDSVSAFVVFNPEYFKIPKGYIPCSEKF